MLTVLFPAIDHAHFCDQSAVGWRDNGRDQSGNCFRGKGKHCVCGDGIHVGSQFSSDKARTDGRYEGHDAVV